MFLSQINIYPIKSLAGISLQTSLVTDRGLAFDRRWMLVDTDGKFLSQRSYPQMALLQPQVGEKGLTITHKQGLFSPLWIPFEPTESTSMEVSIWKDSCVALPVSAEADAWFSEVLGGDCKLVYMPDNSHRPVDQTYQRNREIVNFADGYPFLLIGEASLADLNRRLEDPLPMNRFRPNLVISGSEAFAEDNWKEIRIGDISFFPVKPCARCQVPNTDQETGIRAKEPLQTLATFRKQGQQVIFGMNLLHEGSGSVRIGEEIEVIG